MPPRPSNQHIYRQSKSVKQQWVTVKTHNGYPIQINQYTDPTVPYGFSYRIDDPAFNPELRRYRTIGKAIEAIDTAAANR